MSPTIRHKFKYFHSCVQRAKDRGQKFHFCCLPFAVRPRNVKLNLSNIGIYGIFMAFAPQSNTFSTIIGNRALVSLLPNSANSR